MLRFSPRSVIYIVELDQRLPLDAGVMRKEKSLPGRTGSFTDPFRTGVTMDYS